MPDSLPNEGAFLSGGSFGGDTRTRTGMGPRNSEKSLFSADRLARLSHLERWHFWFVGRRVLVDRLLDKYLGRRGPGLRDLEERPRPILNTVMAWSNQLEGRLSDAVSWPWSSSLVAVYRTI